MPKRDNRPAADDDSDVRMTDASPDAAGEAVSKELTFLNNCRGRGSVNISDTRTMVGIQTAIAVDRVGHRINARETVSVRAWAVYGDATADGRPIDDMAGCRLVIADWGGGFSCFPMPVPSATVACIMAGMELEADGRVVEVSMMGVLVKDDDDMWIIEGYKIL